MSYHDMNVWFINIFISSMGNCVFRGFRADDQVEEMVKVVTSNGGIMELYAPITVSCITNEFPGHGIFCPEDSLLNLNLAPPLPHNQHLHPGQVYYLLPLHNASGTSSAGEISSITITNNNSSQKKSTTTRTPQLQQREDDRPYYSDTNSSTSGSTSTSCGRASSRANTSTPYRMSFENHGHHGMLSKRSSEGGGRGDLDLLPRYNSTSGGVWKVRLVIHPEQLSEILSQESRTEALIESVRTVAKCGGKNSNITNISCITPSSTSSSSSWVSSIAANYPNRCNASSSWRTEQWCRVPFLI